MSYIVPKEIPKNCIECPCGYETEGAFRDECSVLAREYEKDADSVRPNWCPLIEIKTPHGRLGDLDALVKALEQNRLCYVSDIDDESFELGTNRAIDAVQNANTIIEAEGTE